MNILDKIIEFKRKEVAEKKSLVSVKELEQSAYAIIIETFNRERQEWHYCRDQKKIAFKRSY